jgi:deoxyribonuclease-4
VQLLAEAGYDACEIDFSNGFWMDREFAERFGELARAAGIALSIHGPLAAFLGHAERGGKKHHMAVGMLDHTAGMALAAGAAPVVIHPGFLLGRSREQALASVVDQLRDLRERLVKKERAVAFGIEVMGRVNELGSLDDIVTISGNFDWVRPVIDFAHMHATSDGGFTSKEPFLAALKKADAVLTPDTPFHIHFSDVSFANRNEKAHLPYGDGTLRAEPLAQALTDFRRSATVVSESPDEDSNQAIRKVLQTAVRAQQLST